MYFCVNLQFYIHGLENSASSRIHFRAKQPLDRQLVRSGQGRSGGNRIVWLDSVTEDDR